LIYQIEI